MSRYKPIGISLLPEQITILDDRAKKLGLSRSKYLQVLVDADIQGGLLDCTIDADGGKPIVNVREGVNLVVADEKIINAIIADAVTATFKALAPNSLEVQQSINSGRLKQALRNMQQ